MAVPNTQRDRTGDGLRPSTAPPARPYHRASVVRPYGRRYVPLPVPLIFTPASERELRELYSASSRTVKNALTTLLATLDDAPEYVWAEADALPAEFDNPEKRPEGAGPTHRSIVRADGGIVWVLWRERGSASIEIIGCLRAE